jgi:predicted amidohydrolase
MRVAVYQANSGVESLANAAALTAAIGSAKAQGADMLFSPEMVGLLDRKRERASANLRSEADDQVLAAAREAAARHGIWVHIGSLGLKDERSDGRWVNRSFVIDDTGAICPLAKAGGNPPSTHRGNRWSRSIRPGRGLALLSVTMSVFRTCSAH